MVVYTGLVQALVESCHDTVESARDAMSLSLFTIGKKQPIMMLTSCETYLFKHEKLIDPHRVQLLEVMKKVCDEVAPTLPPEIALRLARLAANEMTSRPTIVPAPQGASSALLVSLAIDFGKIVFEQLNMRFISGTMPHFYVLQVSKKRSTNFYAQFI